MTDAEAIEYARLALAAWGCDGRQPRLIKNRENAVFEVRGPEGQRAALRLHRPGYQSNAAINSELWWSDALHHAGLRLPQPIAAQHGKLTVYVENAGRLASMVSWVDGVALGESGADFPWDENRQIRLYSALGQALADLHNHSDEISFPPEFTRPRLDCAGLLGTAPLWGRFWENPALSPAEMKLLHSTGAQLQAVLNTHENAGGDFGLIHADALRENVLVAEDAVTLIDFDDGAFGYRMYELGVAMSQNWELANAGDLARALLAGYQSKRSLPVDAPMLMPAFTTLRCLASCGWAMSRYAPDDPTLIAYGQRAVRAADRYQSGQAFFGI